ncbi:amino acid ABC transporter substrate-binding protein, PAAT family (TC 3.A.1.3.-) [Desulfuromusa kysingii]|uniref:Amino acid ABC transporter substrate-binding protein, PAAT family (TC 3.A.1.3.-) n=1 Tax=Desulfuromusa kysingii TaxID=37625 RepID=A0A1H4BIL6_9BACT|nr:transporter substrate-binding domain-containing protein [Desulfuromusa kysingii]SEA47991.1 amino acid ABC transporter substrate-binding protein, PAAT family (TC 3.A.1.3.-) [Desulfuromusa kysingii]
MKHVKVVVACLLALCIVLPGIVSADTLDEIQDRGVLRVGMEPGYMPFEMTNQKGEIIGFDVDMAKGIAKAMGVKLELVNTAWDGIIPALLTKKYDIIMSGMTVTQERNLKVNFADPYIVIGQTILIKKEIAGDVKSYKDLNNAKYKVGSKLGTTGEKATKRMIPNCSYISFDTEQEGITDLVNGQIDAFVYDLPYMEIAYAQKGENKLVYLDKPFTYEPLGWAIRRGNHDFLNWLNNYMTQVRSDGTYDKIYAKWIQSDAWLKQIQK